MNHLEADARDKHLKAHFAYLKSARVPEVLVLAEDGRHIHDFSAIAQLTTDVWRRSWCSLVWPDVKVWWWCSWHRHRAQICERVLQGGTLSRLAPDFSVRTWEIQRETSHEKSRK